MQRHTACLICLLVLPLLNACSKAPPANVATSPTADSATPAPAPEAAPAPLADVVVPGGPGRACNRVTASEMSAIVGVPMGSTPNDVTEGVTSCSYTALSGAGPTIEYTISAGDGEATLDMGREMKGYDAARGKALADVGADADVIGNAVVINDHGDMVSLTLAGFGREREPALAQRIYAASQGGP